MRDPATHPLNMAGEYTTHEGARADILVPGIPMATWWGVVDGVGHLWLANGRHAGSRRDLDIVATWNEPAPTADERAAAALAAVREEIQRQFGHLPLTMEPAFCERAIFFGLDMEDVVKVAIAAAQGARPSETVRG